MLHFLPLVDTEGELAVGGVLLHVDHLVLG